MLLTFKVKNYKNFKDEICLSMLPAPGQKRLEYSVLREKNNAALCCSAIYGPNGVGKTNLIMAMADLYQIVATGVNDGKTADFSVCFTNDGVKMLYSLKLGKSGTILEEELIADGVQVFKERNTNKVMLKELGKNAYDWFESKFNVLYYDFPNVSPTCGITHDVVGYGPSHGTKQLVNGFTWILYALINGGVLAIDEFFPALHPLMAMQVINLFHNDEINKKNAQLIFTTHNTLFMDASLLRSDEIKFMDKGELYSLSDFPGAEPSEANYLLGRYGAVKYVDLTAMIEKIVRKIHERI